jgi:hypothetical protein
MIRVKRLEDLPQEMQTKIKSDAFMKLVQHFHDRPHITDDVLLQVFGFNRQILNEMYQNLYFQTAHAAQNHTEY